MMSGEWAPEGAATGMTLIEVLISLTVLAIIAGVDVLLLQTGLEAWAHASTRVVFQRAADELMDQLLEGGIDGEGIRDAVELRELSEAAIGFVPLWTDRGHRPDPVRNKDQVFTLERQFKPGATTPVGQIKAPGASGFATSQIKFTYGEGRQPNAPDDLVQFLDPIPLLSELKILYTPDAEQDPEVAKVFRWDSATQRVYESYAGTTRDLLKRERAVAVERCVFLPYDNLNQPIPLPPGGAVSPLQLKRVTAVKLYLVLRQGTQRTELTSFTNVRNVATIGATIAEGTELPMPRPEAITAFSIGELYGLKRKGLVELVVSTDGRPAWKIQIAFKRAPREDDLIVERFQIEAPPGKIVTSAILEQTIAGNEFLSLLAIDRTGLYDYDDDEDLRDLVAITGGSPIVTVTRLDAEGASLFIRP